MRARMSILIRRAAGNGAKLISFLYDRSPTRTTDVVLFDF